MPEAFAAKTSRALGQFRERLIIKRFKCSNDMHRFLSTGSNSCEWRESTQGLAAGTYLFAGGKWHNVKQMDALTLAHA